MFLAEAILRKKDLEREQNQLIERVQHNLTIQEGSTASDPKELICQVERNFKELSRLGTLIKHTNEVNTIETIEGKRTLTHALVYLDYLTDLDELLRGLFSYAFPAMQGVLRNGYHDFVLRREVQVDVRKKLADADRITRELSQLEGYIQKANWSIVVEDVNV